MKAPVTTLPVLPTTIRAEGDSKSSLAPEIKNQIYKTESQLPQCSNDKYSYLLHRSITLTSNPHSHLL